MIKQVLKATLMSLGLFGAMVPNATVKAQSLTEKLGKDPKVTTGQLPNGLKYYIRPNQKPADKVELRLVINTGSILEDEDQLGLAHFTEHMLFNGTKSFPKNELVNKLQSMGVRFGADLNAYTSFDETVYMLPIPTDNPENVAIGFQILKEWAQFALMTDQDINDERKVILEEERTGKGASDRLQKKFLPKMLANSRYAERLPIGKVALLKTFKPDVIRRYYKDFYRPNLMAVVVVGDITTEKAEAMIKEYFSPLTNPKKEKERKVYGIEAYKGAQAMFLTDPEQTNTLMYFSFSAQKEAADVTVGDYRESMVENIAMSALNERFQELANSANPPFAYAGLDNSSFVRGYKALGGAVMPSSDLTSAINALVVELLSVQEYGFNNSEIEMVKKSMLSGMEKSYNERTTTNSANYLGEYQRNFLEGEAFPGIEAEFEMYKKFLPTITAEEVTAKLNKLYQKENRKNYFAAVMSPEKTEDAINSDATLAAAFDKAFDQQPVKREEKTIATNLLNAEPTPGTIVKTEKDAKLDATTYTLSNGVKVTVKSTDFKSDEIIFNGIKNGGTNNYGVKDRVNMNQLSSVIESMGYGDYTPTELSQILKGKNVGLVPSMSETHNSVAGNSDVKSLETLLQLNYLQLTSPRMDQELLDGYIKKMKMQLKFASSNPQLAFVNGMYADMYNNNPLRPIIMPTEEEMNQVDPKRILEIYNNEFGNAKGFHFVIVGNVDEATLKPLMEKYIASLPASGAEPTFKDNGLRAKPGVNNFEMKKGKEAKSLIVSSYFGEMPFSEDMSLKTTLIADILTIRVIEKIREEMGAIYGAGFYGSFEKFPVGSYNIMTQMPTGPESVTAILKETDKEITKLKTAGPEAKDLEKVKIAIVERRKEQLKTNNYWAAKLQQIKVLGYDTDRFLNFDKELNKISANDIKAAANIFLSGKNHYTAVLNPEEGVKSDK